MNRRTHRHWHHWLTIVGGILLAIFMLTGVTILLPKHPSWPIFPPVFQPAMAVDATVAPPWGGGTGCGDPKGAGGVQDIILAAVWPRLVCALDTSRRPIRIGTPTPFDVAKGIGAAWM